jgi:hypothetical protein
MITKITSDPFQWLTHHFPKGDPFMKIMAAWFAGKHEKAMDVASRVLGRRQGSWTVPLRWAEYSWNRDRIAFRKLTFNDR